jgi:hypothetical protein
MSVSRYSVIICASATIANGEIIVFLDGVRELASIG